MANIVFANNASAVLAASISDSDTTIQVASGFGALFPSPTGSQFFHATLVDDNGDIEIVKCTGRSTDNLTVERAQEGTTAQAFTLTVTRVELRLTAAVLEEMLQLNGDTMTGNLDMNTNEIQDAVLTGSSTSVQAGEVAGVPIRGATGVTGNQIVVPVNGADKPTVGGVEVVIESDDFVSIFQSGAGVLVLDPTTRVLVDNKPLRLQGSSSSNRLDISTDDTDFTLAGTGITDLNITGMILKPAAGMNLAGQAIAMEDGNITRPNFLDFSMAIQSVNASTTTEIDYESGSYVALTLDTDIDTLTLSNWPATGKLGVIRLEITHSGAGNDIAWGSIKFASGVNPTLTGTDGAIDFVDLWSRDGGTTVFGVAGGGNWS